MLSERYGTMKIFTRTSALLLVILLLFSGCSFRNTPTVSEKAALDASIQNATPLPDEDPARVEHTVADYLAVWEFPAFTSDLFQTVEAAYADRFYVDDAIVFDIAKTTATTFSDTYFRTIRRGDQTQTTYKLLRSYILTLQTCDAADDIPTADALAARVEGDAPVSGHGVAVALACWDFPLFYIDKLLEAEAVFAAHYYKELPEVETLAADSARTFLDTLYAVIDLSNAEKVTDALIRAYVLSIGDPYAAYRTASEYVGYNSDMSGTFVGIGITVEYHYADNIARVTSVYDGSPAETVGVRIGDMLYAVDDVLFSDCGYVAFVERIRGEVGTTVKLSVLRDGDVIDFDIVRQKLTEKTVTYHIDGDIGTIRILQFKDNTDALFREAIDAMEAAEVKGILFDLRSNPGGYLGAVVNAIAYLVPAGTPIASFGDYASPIISNNAHTLGDLPCVVLCDGYTASAGELFTAALRDYDRMGLLDVTIVGETTYKKGVMQSTLFLHDGSTLTLTVSRYDPPSGENYDGIGITPDVVVPSDETGAEADTVAECGYRILREKLGDPQ